MPPSRHHDVLPNAPHLPLLSFIPRRHSFFLFFPLYLFPFRLQSGLFSPLLPSDPISLFPPPTGGGKGPNLLAAVTEGGGEGGACARSLHRKGDEDGAPMSYFSPRPPLPSPPRLSCHGSGFSGAVGRLGLQSLDVCLCLDTITECTLEEISWLSALLSSANLGPSGIRGSCGSSPQPTDQTLSHYPGGERKKNPFFRGDKERKRRWGSFSSSLLPKRPSFLSVLLGERPRLDPFSFSSFPPTIGCEIAITRVWRPPTHDRPNDLQTDQPTACTLSPPPLARHQLPPPFYGRRRRIFLSSLYIFPFGGRRRH